MTNFRPSMPMTTSRRSVDDLGSLLAVFPGVGGNLVGVVPRALTGKGRHRSSDLTGDLQTGTAAAFSGRFRASLISRTADRISFEWLPLAGPWPPPYASILLVIGCPFGCVTLVESARFYIVPESTGGGQWSRFVFGSKHGPCE
ncbi:hypothetical protein DMENIID0001_070520 [Sergentomyia squamirostris]